MLLQEAGSEAAALQGQSGQQRAGRQQTGQGLGVPVTQWVHAEIQLLQALPQGEGKRGTH